MTADGGNTEPDFVLLPDGRRLAYSLYGDPRGRPCVIAHGDADSRLGCAWLDADAARRHIRLVCPDRPGRGLSDPAPRGYSFASWTEDLTALLRQLGVGEFTAAGIRTGAGFALASAAALGDRVRRTVVVSGIVPFRGVAAYRAIAWYAPVAWWAIRHQARPLGALVAMAAIRYSAREKGLDRLVRLLPESDRALLNGNPDLASQLLEDAREAARRSGAGATADARCYARGLGTLSLSHISGPVVFVHGTADTIATPKVAEFAHRQLPDSRVRWVEGQGHFMLAAWPELLLDEVGVGHR